MHLKTGDVETDPAATVTEIASPNPDGAGHLLLHFPRHPNAAIVTATSQFPAARTLDIVLGQAEQKSYETMDRRIPHSVAGATVIRAGDQLTTEEAMGLSRIVR